MAQNNQCTTDEIILAAVARSPHWAFDSQLRDLTNAFSSTSTSIKRLEGNPGWSGDSAEAAKHQVKTISGEMSNNSEQVAAIRQELDKANQALDEAKKSYESLPEEGLGFWDSAGTWIGAVWDGKDVDTEIQKKEHEKSVEREKAAREALDSLQSKLQGIATKVATLSQQIDCRTDVKTPDIPSGPTLPPPSSGPSTGNVPPGFGGNGPGGPGGTPSWQIPDTSSDSSNDRKPIWNGIIGCNPITGEIGKPDDIGGGNNNTGGGNNTGGNNTGGGGNGTGGNNTGGGNGYTPKPNYGYSPSTSVDSSMSGGVTGLGGAALAGGATAGALGAAGLAGKLLGGAGGGAAGLGAGLNGAGGLAGTTASIAGGASGGAQGGAGSSATGSGANSGGRGGMGMMGGGAPGGGGDKEKKAGSLGLIAPKLEDEETQLTKKSSGAKAGSRAPKA